MRRTDHEGICGSCAAPEEDPEDIARTIVDIVNLPYSQRPFRVRVEPSDDWSTVVNGVADRVGRELCKIWEVCSLASSMAIMSTPSINSTVQLVLSAASFQQCSKLTNAPSTDIKHESRDIARRIQDYNEQKYRKKSTIVFLGNKDGIAKRNNVGKSSYNISNRPVGLNLAVDLV